MKVQQIATVSMEEVIRAVFGAECSEALSEFRDILEANHTCSDTDLALVLVSNLRHNLPMYGVEWRKFCRKYDNCISECGLEAKMYNVLTSMLDGAPAGLQLYLSLGE